MSCEICGYSKVGYGRPHSCVDHLLERIAELEEKNSRQAITILELGAENAKLVTAARPALTFMECYPGTDQECSGCGDDHECPFRALRVLVPIEVPSANDETGPGPIMGNSEAVYGPPEKDGE